MSKDKKLKCIDELTMLFETIELQMYKIEYLYDIAEDISSRMYNETEKRKIMTLMLEEIKTELRRVIERKEQITEESFEG